MKQVTPALTCNMRKSDLLLVLCTLGLSQVIPLMTSEKRMELTTITTATGMRKA